MTNLTPGSREWEAALVFYTEANLALVTAQVDSVFERRMRRYENYNQPSIGVSETTVEDSLNAGGGKNSHGIIEEDLQA